MSNFWTTDDGEDLSKNTATEYESQTTMEPLPDGVSVKALLEKAAWATQYQSTERYISLQWSVVKPDGYANRKVFQKLWVKDDKPGAKDPAAARKSSLRMLSTIDANAGGKLARNGGEPDDDDLALALTNKQMVIKLKVWETDDGKTGNWIVAVSPANSEISAAVKTAKPAAKKAAIVDDLDDDVPF